MRDIKFRGKRVDNGEWVYGYYVFYGHMGVSKHIIITNWAQVYTNSFYVETNTVGQYTGLKDKNGVEIYEGDVMHRDFYWGWYVGYENGAFRRIPLNYIQRINWRHHTLQQEELDTWGIIGNLHDNPELIEERGNKKEELANKIRRG